MGASAAGAVILLKEKQIVAAFRQAGATSAPAAGHTSRFGRARAPGISQVRQRAVLPEAGPGVYYLDELSWAALRRVRRRVLIVVALAAIAAALALLARRLGMGAA